MRDGIFDLIERHAALTVRIEHLCAADEPDDDAVAAAWRERDEVAWLFINAPPTTLAGLRALLNYIVDFERHHEQPWPEIGTTSERPGRDYIPDLHRMLAACFTELCWRRAAA